ncbi:hypothetical protein [Sphingopyxis sp. BSNA05]|uniref:hypothetical protein n=1 Tax=Sphingopyxis sp. BSNA05 TaxID=1236614 RepID=UPI00349F1B7E
MTPATPVVPEKAAPAPAPGPSATTLTLAGLGDLRIGQAVPAGSRWAQISEGCHVLSSPDYPDAYAIVEGGTLRRISISKGSRVKLAEGIGPGASEAVVKQYFSFKATPHKYGDPPAKYLTAPNAASGASALRFEIGSDGTVSQIHVGTMPVLGYVEGCA